MRDILKGGSPLSDRPARHNSAGREGFSAAFKQKLGETVKSAKEGFTRKADHPPEALARTSSKAVVSSKQPTAEETADALEDFVEEGSPDEVNALLADPEVQALLGQLAALLTDAAGSAETTDALSEGADEALFVPLAEAEASETAAPTTGTNAAALQAVDAAEAARLLEGLQEALKHGGADGKLRSALEQLAVAAAAAKAGGGRPGADIRPMLEKLNGQAAGVPAPAAQTGGIASSPLQKLETLSSVSAVQSAAPGAAASDTEAAEEPLFVPLNADTAPAEAPAQPALTVQELAKQIQSGQPVSKTPVLHVPAETFTEDMTQFVSTSFLLNSGEGGITEAKLSLYPQHLGHVEVKLMMHNGQLTAQFAADSTLGKDLLESQLAQLRQSLQSQGIQVDKLEVTQSANAQGFQSGMFQERGQGQQPQSKQGSKAASARIASLGEETAAETAAAQTPSQPVRTSRGMIDVVA